MQRMCISQNNAGFTLIEAVVVLGVAAILAAIAIPSMSHMASDMRMYSASSQLVADLNLARNEAIKRNAQVLICAPGGGSPATCATATTTNNWQNGWQICTGTGTTCDATTAALPNPFVVRGPINSTLVLTAAPAVVIFHPNGTSVASTLTMTGNWSSPAARTQSISATGFIRSTKSL